MKNALIAFATALALASAAYAYSPNTNPAPHSTIAAPAHSTMMTRAAPARAPASLASAADGLTCHTHRSAGRSCSCAAAPTRHGRAQIEHGRDMCVVLGRHPT